MMWLSPLMLCTAALALAPRSQQRRTRVAPVRGVFDAHALWHASTAPLGHLLWVYFVEVDGVPPDDQTAALES